MDMRYRRLGSSGLAVSVVGLGCNSFGRRIDRAQVQSVVDTAIDCGITLFDTADIYGDPSGASEELLGAALKANGRRDEVLIATKFGKPMGGGRSAGGAQVTTGPDWEDRGSRRYIMRAIEASLRRLGTDHVDLYQMHEPDPATPIAETLAALDDLVRAGKVRYLGSSNFTGWQVADAAWTARTAHSAPFVSAQNEYSLLEPGVEVDLVPACEAYGVGLLPYFPLANGLLTGKYRRDTIPEGSRLSQDRYVGFLAKAPWGAIEALNGFAQVRSLSMVDVAIGALAAKPAVGSVIAGATSPEQVRANAAAARWIPTDAELAELSELTKIR